MNKQISELSIDELDQVSGGRSIIDVIIDAYHAAAGKPVMDAIRPPMPKTICMHIG
jgi:bacteriocin-like protein